MFIGVVSIVVSVVASIGLKLLASALQKNEVQDVEQSLPDSAYRRNIPKPYNYYRYDVNWVEPHGESDIFWKKKRGKGNEKRKVLFGRFFGTVCNSQTDLIAGWVNSKGRFNQLQTDPKGLQAGQNFIDNNIIWLDGSYEQQPWKHGALDDSNSQLLAIYGDSYLPNSGIGYRGISCIGFTDADLSEDFKSTTLPNVSLLIKTQEQYDLAAVCIDICTDSGIDLNNIDAGEMVGIEVLGFSRLQNGKSYAEDLADLAVSYSFFITETPEGQIVFRTFERPGVTLDLQWSDFIPLKDNRLWSTSYQDKNDLPKTIALNFIDPDLGYTENSVISDEYPEAKNQNQDSISVPAVLTQENAKELANWHLNQLWIRRVSYEFSLSILSIDKFIIGDVLRLSDGTPVQVKEYSLGADYTLKVSAVRYDDRSQTKTATVANQPVNTASDTTTVFGSSNYQEDGEIDYGRLYLLDIPAASPLHSELGFYVFSDRPTELYLDRGSGSQPELNLVDASTFGDCHTVLPRVSNLNLTADSLPLIDRKSVLEVTLESGSLPQSISNTEFSNVAQIAFVGRIDDGRWVGEYIAFQYADVLTTGLLRLQNFYRGLFGTEYYCDKHIAGEKFFLLTGDTAYWERVIYQPEDIGSSISGLLKVTDNQNFNTTPKVRLELAGQSIYPFAPVDLAQTLDPQGNLRIDFTNRSRGRDRGLGEETKSFQLDLLNNSSVVRTLTGKSPLIYYQSDRTTDNLGNILNGNIYKISSKVGRGFPGLIRDLNIDSSSNIVVTGSSEESKGFKYITNDYTVVNADNGYYLLVDTSTADIDLNLSQIPPVKIWVQNIGTKQLNLLGTLSATDNKLRSNEAIMLLNQGSQWYGVLSGRIDIPQHLIVNSNFTLSQIHHNKIVSVESATTVTVTLDESNLINPKDFHTTIRKKGDGDVLLLEVGNSELEATGNTLSVKYSACYVGFEGNSVWVAFGALSS